MRIPPNAPDRWDRLLKRVALLVGLMTMLGPALRVYQVYEQNRPLQHIPATIMEVGSPWLGQPWYKQKRYFIRARYQVAGHEVLEGLLMGAWSKPQVGQPVTLLLDPLSGRVQVSPFPGAWYIVAACALVGGAFILYVLKFR